MNPIDQALQAAVPTVVTPTREALAPMQNDGHRFVIAKNGLWMETKRPWIHSMFPLSEQTVVAMPYGSQEKWLHISMKVPTYFLQQFIVKARAQFPNECAAWIVWDEETDQMSMIDMVPDIAFPDGVTYQTPRLMPHQHKIVDMHSHGQNDAFFSDLDDKDDRQGVKIAVVIGNVQSEHISFKMRLCCNGVFQRLKKAQVFFDEVTVHHEHRAGGEEHDCT